MNHIIRRVVACTILTAFAGLHAYSASAGYDVVPSVIFSLAYALATVGMMLGWYWARWFTLGIATVGALNCAALVSVGWNQPLILGQGVGFFALLAAVFGRSMSERFERRRGWTTDTWPLRILSWAIVLSVASLAMLIKYLGNAGAWLPMSTKLFTGAVIVVTMAALLLTISKRTAGVLLLGIAGIGTMFLAYGATDVLVQLLDVSRTHQFSCGYSLFIHQRALAETAMVTSGFLPGGLAAIAAVGAFSGPMIRYLKR